MLEHALRYAERGFAIIPVIDKKPTIVRWPKLASTDPVRIRKWWTKWPEANIGIVTIRSGIVVLDVDPRNGGDQSLEEIVVIAGRELLSAPTVLSSRGGRHLYFVRPDDPEVVRALRAFVGPGIDLPAFVVAPPSMHSSGEPYRWEIGDEETAPMVLPDAIIATLFGPKFTLRPPSLLGHGVEGVATIETSGETKSYFPGGAKDFAEIRATLERYARRFARPGALAPTPANDGGTQLARWVGAWIDTPGQWIAFANGRKNSQTIGDKLIAVAREYVRVHGDDGETFFRVALEQKSRISRAYCHPSPTSGDKRHPLAWEPFGRRAWDRAVAEPTTDVPINLDAIAAGTPPSEQTSFARAAAAYSVLLLEAWRLGVPADNFRKDYAAIARALGGVSKVTARSYVLDAEHFGLIERRDVGKARAKGQRGEPTSYRIITARVAAFGERVENLVARTSTLRFSKQPDSVALRLAV